MEAFGQKIEFSELAALASNADPDLIDFTGRYLRRPNWFAAVPTGGHDFGNVVCLPLYRKPPFQVEMVIIPRKTLVVEHCHPHIDAFEFHLIGDMNLVLRGKKVFTPEQVEAWKAGERSVRPVHIGPQDHHWGDIREGPVAFLSIQKWLGMDPTSVGLDWDGPPASPEQKEKWDATARV